MLEAMMNTTRRQFTLSLLAASLATSTTTAHSAPSTETPQEPTLDFNPERYTRLDVTVNGQTLAVRAYEALPTVARPEEPEYQTLNLYIPEAYFKGERVGRYTAQTAPIFLPNQVGGYMPAKPGTPTGRMGPPPGMPAGTAPTGAPPAPRVSAIALALSRGYVVASPGARGRTLRARDGSWTGKAPAAIVDLKAAVRWLRHNASRIPGNTERIVSNGTSAGGALSALLGASGNHVDFERELQAMGAARQRDDIFAVSAYCPITNLEHADSAYEWQFAGITEYRNVAITMLDFKVERKETLAQLDAAQQALSAELRAEFVAYVNSLSLRDPQGQLLRLQDDGKGTLRDHIQRLLIASAQRALDEGANLAQRKGLRIESGKVLDLDFDAHVATMGRMKGLPAFDGFALETGENQLFGNAQIDKRHFTEFSLKHSGVAGAARADGFAVRQMNAMRYAQDSAAKPATHWRIRHGTMDRDTSLAVPTLLAAALRERKLNVDLALPWDRPHSGDYDLDELFAWIDSQV
jgi:alpha/beta hydrolase fold